MTLLELMRLIGLPEEAAEGVLAFMERGSEGAEPLVAALMHPLNAENAERELEERLRGEKWGVLACLLLAAARAHEEYVRLGIPEKVYEDTMGCFVRFVKEHRALTGEWGFDRGWWAWRAACLRLFRIGALEYELLSGEKRALSLHIPSDARLDPEACRSSHEAARAFFAAHFPAYEKAPVVCSSWLLHPALKELLGEGSNIVRFQSLFDVMRVDEDDRSYRAFVFRRTDGDIADYPENTTLQRRLKQYLLAGGRFGSASGVLREEMI